MLQNGLFVTLFGENTESASVFALYVGALFLTFIISYLLGSVNSAIVVSRALYNEDVRDFGSKNAGLTNVVRTYGKKAAILTLIGDLLKVGVAVFITGFLFGFYYNKGICWNEYCYISGFFCMIGHIKPIFYRFKGGKGVLCVAALLLFLAPAVFGALFLLFVALVALTKFISLGSIVCAGLMPFAIQGYMEIMSGEGNYHPIITTVFIFMAIIVIFCHRANIKRLLHGEENKFQFRKDK